MLSKRFFAAVGFILLVLVMTAAAHAQEATTEPTREATAEATVEATAEVTAEPAPSFPGTGSYTVRQPVGGVERRYRIYIPKIYADTAQPVALIIVLHGAGGTGTGTENFTGFDALADKD